MPLQTRVESPKGAPCEARAHKDVLRFCPEGFQLKWTIDPYALFKTEITGPSLTRPDRRTGPGPDFSLKKKLGPE